MLSVADTARALGLSRSAFYEHLTSGRIGPVGFTFGSKRLFPVKELQDWIAAGTPERQKWLADGLSSVRKTDAYTLRRDAKSL
jgi:excisionase family DNA binding protein